MAFKVANFKVPPQPPTPPPLRIQTFRGLNVSVDPTQLEYNESPDMLNMQLDIEGALEKRTGYARLYATSLGAGQVNGMHLYRKDDGTTETLIHHGTKLYKKTAMDGTQPIEIYSGLANAKSHFFTFGGKAYILDGTNYTVYNGSTVAAVVGKIPTMTVATPPAGGGTYLEDKNLLTPKFRQSFSGDGAATAYQLLFTNLDAAAVVASTDYGVTFDKVETTHFTVNRTTGVVTWLVAPAAGTDNVVIQAERTVSGHADKIKKCIGAALYGGTSDTRVFMWGSDNNTLYRSGLHDATYFGETDNQLIGSSETKITGMARQYDQAVIFKESKESSTWAMSYNIDSEGVVTFPTKQINDPIGLDAPDTLAMIENNPVQVTRKGVYTLTGGTVRDERNMTHLSHRIDRLLLAESDLNNAVGIDFDRKYWVAVNGNVYVWDYRLNEWYKFDNIPAARFLEIDGRLYFGSSSAGMVYYFKKPEEVNAYQDDGAAITYRWKMKQEDFGTVSRYKTIKRVTFSMRPGVHTSTNLYYITEDYEKVPITTARMDLFDFSSWYFDSFTFVTTTFPQSVPNKLKVKKCEHFQLMFEGEELNESLGVLGIEIEYEIQGPVK